MLSDGTYYWSDIYNATESTYTVTEFDAILGNGLAVKVSYLDGNGTTETVIGKSTEAVAPASSEPSLGSDKLIGTTGNDVLSALAGNDTLIGGVGADILTGGQGADIFRLNGINDSGNTSVTRDIITDFNSTEGDKINLSSIHVIIDLPNFDLINYSWTKNVPLSFIGDAAFSKIDATGQLRFDAATHTLYGNTNADIKPEFSIQLNGISGLTSSDFIL